MAKKASPPPPAADPAPQELDDYMSMTITEPTTSGEKETYTQRRIRKRREAEANSRPKSKAELAAAADAARDSGLSVPLPDTSKGFQMLARLGFKAGTALGAPSNPNARTEPLAIAVKEDRGGVGMLTERKRKFRAEGRGAGEEEEGGTRAVEEGEYRGRMGRERAAQRVEGMCWGAMRVLEGIERPEEGGDRVPARTVNVLWRGLVRERRERERERRARDDLRRGLSWDDGAGGGDPEADEDDRRAWGDEEEEVEEEDGELEAFLGLEGKERLRRLVEHLRREHRYCFWCKFRYADEAMEGCPGVEEDDHD